MKEKRFGGDAKTLILALHGGTQAIDDTLIPYLDFVEMSRLEDLAGPERVVIFPQAPRRMWSLYTRRDLKRLAAILEREKPQRVYACGFSMGATFLIHACRYFQFAGIVSCSAVVPPLDGLRRLPPYLPTDSIFWAGDGERQKNRDAAAELHARFSALGRSTLEIYPGRHRWPAAWNQRIVDYFGLGKALAD